jgi:hypothetical protein
MSYNSPIVFLPLLSWRLANNQNAHEEDHDEEDPHKITYPSPWQPSARGPLLPETDGDVLHVPHQLGVHSG